MPWTSGTGAPHTPRAGGNPSPFEPLANRRIGFCRAAAPVRGRPRQRLRFGSLSFHSPVQATRAGAMSSSLTDTLVETPGSAMVMP